MRNLANSYHPKKIFWDEFPQFLDVDPFAELYSKDRSPGKRVSSMKMWAMCLIYDPESDFYNLPQKEDKVKSAMNRNHRIKLNLEETKKLADEFYNMFMTQADKSLLNWERRMKERDEFLEGIKWSLDSYNEEGRLVKGTADQLDKLHSQTAKHFKEHQIIYKEVQELKAKEDRSNKKSNIQELDV